MRYSLSSHVLLRVAAVLAAVAPTARAQQIYVPALATALIQSAVARIDGARSSSPIVEFGSACGSALRGPVACDSPPPAAVVALVAEVDAAVGRRALATSAAAARRGAMVPALPDACLSAQGSPAVLLIDEVTGSADRPVLVYRALTMEPGTRCRVGGGAKVQLELVRRGDGFEVVRDRVLEYY